jgi:hypothetical protein
VERVVAEFIADVQKYQHAACKSYREACYIDNRICFVPEEIPDCDLEKIAQHSAPFSLTTKIAYTMIIA